VVISWYLSILRLLAMDSHERWCCFVCPSVLVASIGMLTKWSIGCELRRVALVSSEAVRSDAISRETVISTLLR
jgi:hypothetical protein